LDLLQYLRTRKYVAAREEELLYEYVASELEQGDLRKGLWTKALAESSFNDGAAKAKYVLMRVDSLRAEMEIVRPQLKQRDAAQEQLQELLESGCSQEAIEYLTKPMRAAHYSAKYKVSMEKLQKAVSVKKIKACWVGDILWVEDRRL
jgi:uncharacterized protein YoaH (UPF0181 family)